MIEEDEDIKSIDFIVRPNNLTFKQEIVNFCKKLNSSDLLSKRSIWQKFVDWRDESPYLSFFLCLTLLVIPLIPWIIARQLANTTQKSISEFQQSFIAAAELADKNDTTLSKSYYNLPVSSMRKMSIDKINEIFNNIKNKKNAGKENSEIEASIHNAILSALNLAAQDAADDKKAEYQHLVDTFNKTDPGLGSLFIEVDGNQSVCFKVNFNRFDLSSEERVKEQVSLFKKVMLDYFGMMCNFAEVGFVDEKEGRTYQSLTYQIDSNQAKGRILKWYMSENAVTLGDRAKAKQKILDGFEQISQPMLELNRLTNSLGGLCYKFLLDLPVDSQALCRLETISLKIQALFLDRDICHFETSLKEWGLEVQIWIPDDKLVKIINQSEFSHDSSEKFLKDLLKLKAKKQEKNQEALNRIFKDLPSDSKNYEAMHSFLKELKATENGIEFEIYEKEDFDGSILKNAVAVQEHISKTYYSSRRPESFQKLYINHKDINREDIYRIFQLTSEDLNVILNLNYSQESNVPTFSPKM